MIPTGVSGTADIYDRSSTYSKILKGQYDLIGFDPRGVNMSKVCDVRTSFCYID
jgi:hypothetical protein